MDLISYMQHTGRAAREAATAVAKAGTAKKNSALRAIGRQLAAHREEILAANAQDMTRGRENALDAPLLDRLELTSVGIDAMIDGLSQVAALPAGAAVEIEAVALA